MAARRMTAAAALLLSLGMSATVVLTAVSLLGASANAAAALEPPVEPCDVGEICESTPEVTVTVTTTLDTPTPSDPVTTITKTVTPTSTKTSKSAAPTTQSTPTTTQAPTISQNPQPIATPTLLPTTAVPSASEPEVALPTVSDTLPTQTPADTGAPTEPVQLEMHQAQDEFDQKSLTQKLSIPALVLVLLALFAVLIFEGRLRRMAHAAAVRKAGPQTGRPDQAGYPAGPGYATASFPAPGYPGGTAYAPIISFVPVQTYPSGQPQYGPGYQQPDPYAHPDPYTQPTAYTQPDPYEHQAPADPIVLHQDEFDAFSRPEDQGGDYRDPFEPVIPPSDLPETEIPYGGAAPYEETHETPLGPASAAEPGDAEPWEGAEDVGTAILPLPPQQDLNPTIEAPRPPKRTIWRRDK